MADNPFHAKDTQFHKEYDVARRTIVQASKAILEVLSSKELGVEFKGNESPVGIADYRANNILCTALHNAFPDDGILSEESPEKTFNPEKTHFVQGYESALSAMKEWSSRKRSWIIDPLDGTRQFINGNDEFGILVGLIEDGKPVFGINYFPKFDTWYYAAEGQGAYREDSEGITRLSLDKNSIENLEKVLVSRSISQVHEELLLRLFNHVEKIGSLGLKVCRVAEGLADAQIFLSDKSSLWDVCSSEIIINEAGGKITDWNGNSFKYSKDTVRNIYGVISSSYQNHARIIDRLQSSLDK
ncbi:MAG: 3'(2'),5'-bisphosphate nucleotidase CysQ family protein [Candidatus Woesearchaeota archaeon]